MATQAQIQAEIERKARLGIPLSNPTPEAQAAYNAVRNQVNTESMQALIAGQSYAGTQYVSSPSTITKASNNINNPQQKQTAVVTVSSNNTPKQKREAEIAAFTGWDNIPEVRDLQMKTAQIYIDTGRWDTPEQKAYHDQAEKIRKYTNPMYAGSAAGPLDWMDAGKIALADDQFGTANYIESGIDAIATPQGIQGILQVGVLVIGAVAVMSFFK